MVSSESSTDVTSVYSGRTGNKESEPGYPTNNVPSEQVEKQTALANVGEDGVAATKEAADAGSTSEAKPGEAEEDESEYPARWRLGLITIALCLSVFCMALVCCFTPYSYLGGAVLSKFLVVGQHHYCHRDPSNHRSVPRHRRRRLVWLGLPSHDVRRPAHLW